MKNPITISTDKVFPLVQQFVDAIQAARKKGLTPRDIQGALLMLLISWGISECVPKEKLAKGFFVDVIGNYETLGKLWADFQKEKGGLS